MAARQRARRSSFFFLGRLDPPELANFNLQNLFLPDRDARLEVFGHTIAIWWPDRRRDDFDDLRDAARGWITAVAAAYYLEAEIALEPSLVGWVEALDVVTNEAMLGVVDPRFLKVPIVDESDSRNEPMRRAIDMAVRLRASGGDIERAAAELLRAANDPSEQALLSAFRSLECIRRLYDPTWANRQAGWRKMHADLRVSAKPRADLSEAAEAIRHGDVPLRRRARHPVNTARKRRDSLLAYTRRVVSRAICKHT